MLNQIKLSVVIPFYNVEAYLSKCIDSIILNNDLNLEIILVDDGSTDYSSKIAEEYESQFHNISLIQQDHSGPSIARNRGIDIARGEYIAFIDSDDWVTENSLTNLYNKATEFQADMVMGNMVYEFPNGDQVKICESIPNDIKNQTLTGKQCFISLMESGNYFPMACSYICKKDWINEHNLRFDEGIIHEDEVWTQIALCEADKVVITDLDFYHYRKREGSIMHTLDPQLRLESLLYIVDRFFCFADRYSFNDQERKLKSWIYTNTYRIYAGALIILAKSVDSTLIPSQMELHHLDLLNQISEYMDPDAKKECQLNYTRAKAEEKKYLDWINSPWNVHLRSLSEEDKKDKRILLFYNSAFWYRESLRRWEEVSDQYLLTDDRKYFDQAFAVVFDVPDLMLNLDHDIEKADDQVWIAWSMECEKNYPWPNDEIRKMFDIHVNYHPEADVVCPYYGGIKKDKMPTDADLSRKENKVCMFISSPVNQSKRQEYLAELMQYIDIDSYGTLYNNKRLDSDDGWSTKIKTYSKYKFIIAFENAIGKDYVTEKFYDPLLAASVPIYLGAPNVDEFSPSDNCYINVNDFISPKELANHIKMCFQNDDAYLKYHKWRDLPWCSEFEEKVNELRVPPLIRLCSVLNERQFK